jgi:hypothetical protein
MAVIAVMRGKPKDGYHHSRSNKHCANCGLHVNYNTTTQALLKQTTTVVRVMIYLKIVTTIVTSTTYKQ